MMQINQRPADADSQNSVKLVDQIDWLAKTFAGQFSLLRQKAAAAEKLTNNESARIAETIAAPAWSETPKPEPGFTDFRLVIHPDGAKLFVRFADHWKPFDVFQDPVDGATAAAEWVLDESAIWRDLKELGSFRLEVVTSKEKLGLPLFPWKRGLKLSLKRGRQYYRTGAYGFNRDWRKERGL